MLSQDVLNATDEREVRADGSPVRWWSMRSQS